MCERPGVCGLWPLYDVYVFTRICRWVKLAFHFIWPFKIVPPQWQILPCVCIVLDMCDIKRYVRLCSAIVNSIQCMWHHVIFFLNICKVSVFELLIFNTFLLFMYSEDTSNPIQDCFLVYILQYFNQFLKLFSFLVYEYLFHVWSLDACVINIIISNTNLTWTIYYTPRVITNKRYRPIYFKWPSFLIQYMCM